MRLLPIRHFNINEYLSIEHKMTTSFTNIVRAIHTHFLEKITNIIMTRGTWVQIFNFEK